MKKFLYSIAILCLTSGVVGAQTPYEQANDVFRGFLAETRDMIPDCDHCTIHVLYSKDGDWTKPDKAQLVVYPGEENEVRLTVSGDDWENMRSELRDCTQTWVNTGGITCIDRDWQAAYADLRKEHRKILDALRVIGTAVTVSD